MRCRSLPFLPVALALMFACNSAEVPEPYSETRFLMDTVVTITVHDSTSSRVPVSHAVDSAFTLMAEIEKTASAHLPQSELYRINASSFRQAVLSPELKTIIAAAIAVSRETGGAFDPTLGRVKDLWPFNTSGAVPPDSADVRRALALTGCSHLHLTGNRLTTTLPGIELDLGGIAKGRAIDRAVTALQEAGISAGIVDAGGDLRIFGRNPGKSSWNIGIRDPDGNGIFGVISTQAASIATSGDYERFFMYHGTRYHHLLDPASGYPARGTASVTIVAPSALKADAVATAVFIMGAGRGMAFIEAAPDVEGIIISRANGSLTCEVSPGLRHNFRRLK